MDYMVDSDEDEQLKRVLEMSRLEDEVRQARENKRSKPHSEVIEVPDSDDDVVETLPPRTKSNVWHGPPQRPDNNDDAEAAFQADLARALAASAAESNALADIKTDPSSSSSSVVSSSPSPPPSSIAPSTTATSEKNAAPSTTSQIAFLSERAKMEAERLQRAQKRLRVTSSDYSSQSSLHKEPPSKRRNVDLLASSSSASAQPAMSASSSKAATKFWDGEIRPVANKFAEPSKDTKPTFRLTEILDKDDPADPVQFIILSSYCTDCDWLSEILPQGVPVILIGQPGERSGGNPTVGYHPVYQNWVMATPFLRGGFGCMHMKFMLVFYSTGRLRIMITTANMLGYDWQQIENMAWVQDIPKRPTVRPHDSQAADFAATFQHVLKKLNVEDALRSHLNGDFPHLPIMVINDMRRRWDFSAVDSKCKLIASIVGKHEGWPDVLKSGHTMLMKGIRDLGARLPDGKELRLEYQGSSIGTYSSKWINEFYDSAKGISPEKWLDSPKTKRTTLPYPKAVKILFPSLSTVDNSRLGRAGGGTMWCSKKQWEGSNFPQQIFYDSKSKRGRALMHTKMIIGVFGESPNTLGSTSKRKAATSREPPLDPNVGGWCYLGSHNFTPSAWGTLTGTSFTPVLNVTNYELGILFTLPAEDTEAVANELACWQRPPPAYRRGIDVPWMQATHGHD